MKSKFLRWTLAVSLVLVTVLAFASDKIPMITGGSYATGDTTGWISCGAGDNLTLVIHFNDSVNVSAILDFRNSGYASATAFQSYTIVADSTNSVNTTGFEVTKTLRRYGTDNIPGANQVRLKMLKKSTKNGVTTPTYDAWLWRN